ncbi:MAG: hypothetical protein J6M62_01315 [Selenomonadaceae bacterium]|nr:hypothetical protein [Selenomonadaceae bacterium]
MNLTFDLQLLTSVGDTVSASSGFSGSGKDYSIGDVKLSAEFASGVEFANFAEGSTGSGFSGKFAATADTTTSAIAFKGANGSNAPTGVGMFDGGKYNWSFNSKQITSISLGSKTKINLLGVTANGLNATLAAAGGQEITFGAGVIGVKVDTVGTSTETATTISSAVALKGGASEVSLLSGSALEGSTLTGEAGGVISLLSADTKKNVFNLKGSSSEAVVTIGGADKSTVHSSSVDGFTKITFDAKKGKSAQISLSAIKDSGVAILGSTTTGADGADEIIIGTDVKRSSVSITGAGGQDKITLSGTGAEKLVMSKTATGDGDTVTGWASTDGDKDEGNTLIIDSLMSTFYAHTVKGTQAVVGQSANGAVAAAVKANATTTLNSSATNAASNYAFGVNIKAADDTYSALLVGGEALTSVQGVNFGKYDYVIADTGKTLNLGTANKTTVVLANTVDEKHWGDTNVYQNVSKITSSSKGKSLIINGVENTSISAKLEGTNDSIWGANNIVGDEITLKKEKNQIVFSGANDGVDSVKGYVYGTSASKANAVRFLDGIGYVAADKKALVFGADENNGVHVGLLGTTTGEKVAYGFGTEGDKYLAMVDATEGSNGKITYGSDVNVYIGQGDSSYISVDSAAKDVKLGWDGGAGYVNIGGVDGTMAADGAVIVGLNDYAQSIAGSSRGASSISGGFVADEWTDTKADTLVGGGVATKSTTFFVGEKMGKDEIQNLSSKDNIVFLGSKFEDLVKFTPETTDTEFSFKFADNLIEASAGGKKLSAIKDVSLYFDDGTYIWNGSTIEKAE